MKQEEAQALVLQFLASLTLCDHLGDAWNDARLLAEKVGIDWLDDNWDDDEIRDALAKRGVTTLQGTSLADE